MISLTKAIKWLLPYYRSILIYHSTVGCCPTKTPRTWALNYYGDMTLSQTFQPMATQLSMKAVLPLAKGLATASCRSSNTGSWPSRRGIERLFQIPWREWRRGTRVSKVHCMNVYVVVLPHANKLHCFNTWWHCVHLGVTYVTGDGSVCQIYNWQRWVHFLTNTVKPLV